MTMRRPSDRAQMWDEWRRRIAGERIAVDDTPRCGFYEAKRFGRRVGVQIDLLQDIDPATGELVAPERIAAFIGADIFFDQHLDEIWLRCCGSPISEAEFERLSAMPRVDDLSREAIV